MKVCNEFERKETILKNINFSNILNLKKLNEQLNKDKILFFKNNSSKYFLFVFNQTNINYLKQIYFKEEYEFYFIVKNLKFIQNNYFLSNVEKEHLYQKQNFVLSLKKKNQNLNFDLTQKNFANFLLINKKLDFNLNFTNYKFLFENINLPLILIQIPNTEKINNLKFKNLKEINKYSYLFEKLLFFENIKFFKNKKIILKQNFTKYKISTNFENYDFKKLDFLKLDLFKNSKFKLENKFLKLKFLKYINENKNFYNKDLFLIYSVINQNNLDKTISFVFDSFNLENNFKYSDSGGNIYENENLIGFLEKQTFIKDRKHNIVLNYLICALSNFLNLEQIYEYFLEYKIWEKYDIHKKNKKENSKLFLEIENIYKKKILKQNCAKTSNIQILFDSIALLLNLSKNKNYFNQGIDLFENYNINYNFNLYKKIIDIKIEKINTNKNNKIYQLNTTHLFKFLILNKKKYSKEKLINICIYYIIYGFEKIISKNKINQKTNFIIAGKLTKNNSFFNYFVNYKKFKYNKKIPITNQNLKYEKLSYFLYKINDLNNNFK